MPLHFIPPALYIPPGRGGRIAWRLGLIGFSLISSQVATRHPDDEAIATDGHAVRALSRKLSSSSDKLHASSAGTASVAVVTA